MYLIQLFECSFLSLIWWRIETLVLTFKCLNILHQSNTRRLMFNWGKFSNWGSKHAFTAAVIDSNTMRFKRFVISLQRGQCLEGIEGQPNEKHWLKLPAAAHIEWIWSLIHDKVLARAPNQTTLLFYTIDPKTPLKPGAPGILPTFIQHRRSHSDAHIHSISTSH